MVVTPSFRHIGALALFPGIGSAPAGGRAARVGRWDHGGPGGATMIALHRTWAFAIPLAWVFNVFGILDLLHNAVGAAVHVVAPTLGPAAYVVAFAVPGMLVCHVLVFRVLLRRS